MAISIYNWTKDTGTTSASFDIWVAAQGSTPRSLSIGTDITVTGNLTLPSTIDITTITNNAKFTGSGKTLTINKMSAQPRHQIFDAGLNVLFASGATTYILPEWFGSGNGNVCFGSGVVTPLSKVYIDGGVSIGNNIEAGSGNLYVSGSGSFSDVVHGGEPTIDTHLTTKYYVDNHVPAAHKHDSLYDASDSTQIVKVLNYDVGIGNITPSGTLHVVGANTMSMAYNVGNAFAEAGTFTRIGSTRQRSDCGLLTSGGILSLLESAGSETISGSYCGFGYVWATSNDATFPSCYSYFGFSQNSVTIVAYSTVTSSDTNGNLCILGTHVAGDTKIKLKNRLEGTQTVGYWITYWNFIDVLA